ncbi:MAG: thiolase family protein [Desulfosporosinus sp.]|jgi:acetyl-CoA C-acetyltransferase
MKDVVIVSAVRTATGVIGGTIKDVKPQKLAAIVIEEVVKRAGISPEIVEEVILGWSRQTTEAANIARHAALLAGMPEYSTGFTVHRQCGAGLTAISCGVQEIQTGRCEVVVAGGTESLSQAPFYLKGARFGYKAGDVILTDALTEAGYGGQPPEIYGKCTMGDTAENVAEQFNVTRQEQDELAVLSQTRCQEALKNGVFKEEIVPVEIKTRKGTIVFDTDEGPRPSTMETLAKLPPVFKEGGTVTAGNACGRNDCAAAVVLMSADKAKELGLKPWARFIGDAVVGVDPKIMGVGPVYAVRKVLKQTGLTLDDIDLIEINEAFCSQAVYCIRELGMDINKVNVNGGATALGHPVGATGARLMVTLLHEARRRKIKYGMVTLCIGGGQGQAMIVEMLDN